MKNLCAMGVAIAAFGIVGSVMLEDMPAAFLFVIAGFGFILVHDEWIAT